MPHLQVTVAPGSVAHQATEGPGQAPRAGDGIAGLGSTGDGRAGLGGVADGRPGGPARALAARGWPAQVRSGAARVMTAPGLGGSRLGSMADRGAELGMAVYSKRIYTGLAKGRAKERAGVSGRSDGRTGVRADGRASVQICGLMLRYSGAQPRPPPRALRLAPSATCAGQLVRTDARTDVQKGTGQYAQQNT